MSSELRNLVLKLVLTVVFDQVLVVSGDEVKVGDPTVAGATVTATAVVADGKAKKGYRLQVQEKDRIP